MTKQAKIDMYWMAWVEGKLTYLEYRGFVDAIELDITNA